MRHPQSTVASVAASLALSDIARRQADRQSRAEAFRDAETAGAVGQLVQRLKACRRREQALERELQETKAALVQAQAALLRIGRH